MKKFVSVVLAAVMSASLFTTVSARTISDTLGGEKTFEVPMQVRTLASKRGENVYSSALSLYEYTSTIRNGVGVDYKSTLDMSSVRSIFDGTIISAFDDEAKAELETGVVTSVINVTVTYPADAQITGDVAEIGSLDENSSATFIENGVRNTSEQNKVTITYKNSDDLTVAQLKEDNFRRLSDITFTLENAIAYNAAGTYPVTVALDGTTTIRFTSGTQTVHYTGSATNTVTLGTRSSGGGGGVPSITTDKTTNPDGSTTTTVTNKNTGTVTETTVNTDGSTKVVETKNDGTVTETNKTTDGAESTVVTNKDGEVTDISAKVPSSAKEDETVTLPLDVNVGKNDDSAPVISVDVPEGGATVKIPVDNVTPGTVVVTVNEDGTETVEKKLNTDEDGIVLALDGDAKFKIVDNSKNFVDVNNGDWYKDAVDFVAARGVLNGTGNNEFSPNVPMTRAMIVVALHNYENNPESTAENLFKDVDVEHWFNDAVAWGIEKGIVEGYDENTFGPNDVITREQLAAILWRYVGSPASTHSLNAFDDADEISDYAKQAMAWANENGIINGYTDEIIGSKDSATRAQVAQMFKNFMEKY